MHTQGKQNGKEKKLTKHTLLIHTPCQMVAQVHPHPTMPPQKNISVIYNKMLAKML